MIVVALCIMTEECELIIDYDMVVRLGKGWFQIDRYVSLKGIAWKDTTMESWRRIRLSFTSEVLGTHGD